MKKYYKIIAITVTVVLSGCTSKAFNTTTVTEVERTKVQEFNTNSEDYKKDENIRVGAGSSEEQSQKSPFYGIWCGASKSKAEARKMAEQLQEKGFSSQVFLTTDWSNLNREPWYVVAAGVYLTKEDAEAELLKVQEVDAKAYVKYSGDFKGNESVKADAGRSGEQSPKSPFYGIWCGASKSEADARKMAEQLHEKGFSSQVFLTSDWSNLNREPWYVVTAGVYLSKDEADAELLKVQEVDAAAYVKYSGDFKGNESVNADAGRSGEQNPMSPFYGIWCGASKSEAEAQKMAEQLHEKGFSSQVFLTSDWSDLNHEPWYVVTAGVYFTKEDADAELLKVQEVDTKAYVKYSGEYIGYEK